MLRMMMLRGRKMMMLRMMRCRVMMLRMIRWRRMMLRMMMSRGRKRMMWRMMRLRRRKMMILRMLMRRRTDPKTTLLVLCEPAQSKCKLPFHKSHFIQKFTGKMPRPRLIPERGHTLCASLRSRNALQHSEKCRRPEWAPWSSTGLYSYRKNPSVWTHCLGNQQNLGVYPIFRLKPSIGDCWLVVIPHCILSRRAIIRISCVYMYIYIYIYTCMLWTGESAKICMFGQNQRSFLGGFQCSLDFDMLQVRAWKRVIIEKCERRKNGIWPARTQLR